IVLRVQGEIECRALLIESIHDGRAVGGGGSGLVPPPRWTSGTRVLVATPGFWDLNIVAPDAVMINGFLGTGTGTIQLCGQEFHYASLPIDGIMALDGSGSPVPNVATNSLGSSASVTAAQAAAAGLDFYRGGLTGTWYEPATSGQG